MIILEGSLSLRLGRGCGNLVGTGVEVEVAAIMALRANRLAGYYAKPTLATQLIEIIRHITREMKYILNENEGISEQIYAL